MGNKKLKTRKEIDAKYKWNIENMYSDSKLWEEDFQKVKMLADEFVDFSGKFTESANQLLASLKAADEIGQIIEKLYVYSKMKLDEDNTVSQYQEQNGRVMGLLAEVGAKMSFYTPELLSQPEEKILGFIDENPELELYRLALMDTLKQKKHVLSKSEEALLAKLSEVTDSSNNIFSMLNDADMKFGTIKDENGEEIEVTHGSYISLMESHDREVRKAAFDAVYNTYKSHINTLSALYNTSVKNDVITSQIRNYGSSRKRALEPNEIPESVYDNMIDVVHEYLPVMHDYVALRKDILGYDELHMYDVYVPLVKVPEKEIPFEEAVEMMNKALAPLGDDYLKIVNKGVKDRWIDVYENTGKTSGAYSFGSYDSYPYILLNYTGRLQDVLTLVHEMGHSMHSFYTRTNQPYTYGNYSIFVAEVASTVNECLLLHHLLQEEQDKDMKRFILNRFIEEFRATVFRQTMFAEFELNAHRFVEEGGSLTSDWLSEEYDRLNTLYFGDAMSHDDLIKYEWSRIPHFYRAYYVYQYATGFSAATAISEKILKEGNTAVESYKEFLSMGSSAYPVEELKVAGVDMTTKEPLIEAMEMFKSLVEEFKSL